MFWRAATILAVALMAFGGSASALGVGAVPVYGGTSCGWVTSGYTFSKTIDLEILPGTRVMVAGNAAGTLGYGATGFVHLRVDGNTPLTPSTFRTIAYPYSGSGGPCGHNQILPPMDITDAFPLLAGQTSPVTVSVTFTFTAWHYGSGYGGTGWLWGSTPIYLTGVGGVAGVGVVSLTG